MGDAAQNTIIDEQRLVDSTLMLTSSDSQANRKKHLANVAALGQVSEVIDAVTETADKGSADTASQPKTNFGGKYFHLDNGIPQAAIMEMLKNNTENQDAQFDLIRQTSLLKGGMTQDATTGVISIITGTSLVTQEADCITTSATQQASSLYKEGANAFAEGVSGIIGEGISEGLSAGASEEVDANVEKYQHALDAESQITSKETMLTNATGTNGQRTLTGKEIEASQSPVTKRAIKALETGRCDIGEGDYNFGSEKVGGKNKYAVKRSDKHDDDCLIDTGNGNNSPVTVKEAIASASEEQRSNIRDRMQKQLDNAKKAQTTKLNQIEVKKQNRSRQMSSLVAASKGGITISQANNKILIGQADAEKQVLVAQNQTLQSVGNNQDKGKDAALQNSASTFKLLSTLLDQAGRRV